MNVVLAERLAVQKFSVRVDVVVGNLIALCRPSADVVAGLSTASAAFCAPSTME